MVYIINRDGNALMPTERNGKVRRMLRNSLAVVVRRTPFTNQAPYLVKGFRLFDKVMFNGQECFIFGRRSSGSFDIRRFNGTKVHAGINCKKLKFLEITKKYLLTKKRLAAIPPTNEFVDFLAEIS